MRITRYIIYELLTVFLVTLAGMTMLMMLVGLAQEAIRQGLTPVPVMRLVPYALPNALRFAVPGTILFAACSVYGRMSAANEFVAIKSLGISPMQLMTPAFVLAVLISLVAVWLNDMAVSWGRLGMQRVVFESAEEIAYGMLRKHKSYRTPAFSVIVQRVEDRRLVRPTLSFHSGSGNEVTVTAREGELQLNMENETLTVILVDAEFDLKDDVTGRFRGRYKHEIPLGLALRKGGSTRPQDLPLRDIPKQIEAQEANIVATRRTLATEAAWAMMTGDLNSLAGDGWKSRHRDLNHIVEGKHRLTTEIHRRWANGFSCFFFVFVGTPLSIRLRSSDLWSTFAVCFLPILIVYYPLLAVGVDRAKCGAWPPYSVWIGNAILAIVGGWLIRRVIRH